jgi:hypothetical protein
MPNALPDWRWHMVQWHAASSNGSPSTRYRIAPHWQPPVASPVRDPPEALRCEIRRILLHSDFR